MRLRPKNFTFTSACAFVGLGLGVLSLMKRLEAGPLPSFISVFAGLELLLGIKIV
jgi:hypothetical protein